MPKRSNYAVYGYEDDTFRSPLKLLGRHRFLFMARLRAWLFTRKSPARRNSWIKKEVVVQFFP